MISKTAMSESVRGHRWAEVAAALAANPALLDVRDERGRNWLHLCCSVDITIAGRDAEASVRTAETLLDLGFGIDQEAFVEGAWKATPLWFAIGRGKNHALAQFLLSRGCDPNYCLWAAVFNTDLAAMRLLVAHGASVDDPADPETPFLAAIGWSRFAAAEQLLELGADVDAVDAKGATALHRMLKKASPLAAFAMIAAHGARGDIPDAAGQTAAAILRRKQDPAFHAIADRLKAG